MAENNNPDILTDLEKKIIRQIEVSFDFDFVQNCYCQLGINFT